MKFSVLLSVYAKENPIYLKEALDSIWYNQTLKPDEIVIVKDGILPNDLNDTISKYSKNAPIKIVSLSTNHGLGTALNIGLGQCSNEIVARMDSDDISKPERFHKQIEIFQSNSDIDILSCWIDEFRESPENVVSTKKVPEHHNEIIKYSLSRSPLNHPAVIFKKSSVQNSGSYQPFPLFEDYFLWARMLQSGFKFYNLQESLLLFRTNFNTYRRRGGLKHAIIEIKLQIHFFRIGFINFPRMISNIFLRFIIRILPNLLRYLIYEHLLRKKY